MTHVDMIPDTDIHRVLCVVAHPDDMEYGASAAVAKWTRRGASVTYLLVTAGEAGIRDNDPSEVGPLRRAEQEAACRTVGVSDLRFLDQPDGMLEYGLSLRREIARVIRDVRPDTILTGTWDIQAPWGMNQADHRAVGLATLDAARDADNPWVFRELVDQEGLNPWKATRLIVTGTNGRHAIDVEEQDVQAAVASLECHREYLAALPNHPKPSEFIPASLREGGTLIGLEYALHVDVHEL